MSVITSENTKKTVKISKTWSGNFTAILRQPSETCSNGDVLMTKDFSKEERAILWANKMLGNA